MENGVKGHDVLEFFSRIRNKEKIQIMSCMLVTVLPHNNGGPRCESSKRTAFKCNIFEINGGYQRYILIFQVIPTSTPLFNVVTS